jgi:hypothetical protein
MWNKKAGRAEADADLWEKCGGTVIVAENAYLQKVDKTAYAISTHGHNGSGWFPTNDEDRFSKLGFEVKPMQTPAAGHILVCGQRGIGSKLMASPPQWAEKFAKKYVANGAPVRIRLHPGNFAPGVPLLQDLAGAHRCMLWSSSAGVRALVEGIATRHHAPHWICEGWAPNRGTALNKMAHGQWSVAEIESGEPFARMQAENWGPRWV